MRTCMDCAYFKKKESVTHCSFETEDQKSGVYCEVHPLYKACKHYKGKHLDGVPIFKAERLW
jgi:hypothetical protein